MLDLRRIRDDADGTKRALAKRGAELPSIVDELLGLDVERRRGLTEVNELKARRNEASKAIGELKRRGEYAEESIQAMRTLGDRISEIDATVARIDERLAATLLQTPNTPLPEVPGGGEEANKVVKAWGAPREFPFEPLPHWELGERLRILDLKAGSRVSGSGFPVLRGRPARDSSVS